jgi:2,4-dienoyl-CoA reductase (NADPH2)
MGKVSIPIITSNRINTPEVAEEVLADGCANMVSMARPFLADPHFVAKAAAGQSNTITPCIACNQACLDHTFGGKISSCLVNPRACYETELPMTKTDAAKRVAVIGAGPAGVAAAMTAAQVGHDVTLFDQADKIGGQLNMAKQVPGKEEFWGLVDWFETMIAETGVKTKLGNRVTTADLNGFDEVVVATGVMPRDPEIPGQDSNKVCGYIDILKGRVKAGENVVVIGAGGIGFDVSEFLVHSEAATAQTPDLAYWLKEWGVGDPAEIRGGVLAEGPQPAAPARNVTLLQRKAERPGKRLGKTTGWIHRSTLKMKGVKMIGGVNYEAITEEGLRISHGEARENPTVIPADTIVLCAGQLSERSLADELVAQGHKPHVIGGADVAAELDAKRAIDQGVRLALSL